MDKVDYAEHIAWKIVDMSPLLDMREKCGGFDESEENEIAENITRIYNSLIPTGKPMGLYDNPE